MKTMKAVLLSKPTTARDVTLVDCQIPSTKPGWVLIRVKAFGMNHSEQVLRKVEISASYISKPIIPGIECVGEIVDPSDSTFHIGQRVIGMMGGMGRNFNGSYAEYVLLPSHHVFLTQSSLPWDKLAAIPETYFTAWGSLFEALCLSPDDTLLVRGATCALGYAAIQFAKALGCKVAATTHRESKRPILERMDVEWVLLDEGKLHGRISGISKALELVGPKTLRDTLTCVANHGVVCSTGILGGINSLNNFDPIKEIPNGVYLTGFFSNNPTQKAIDNMFQYIEEKHISPQIGRIYSFMEIAQACWDIDNGETNGKIVITMID
jgi:NADPH:quinone reductase-like Zn-dependent oxidoreductase